MKNLTRILALVLVFTMMVSSAAFAGRYTDVADDSTYAEAVEVLSALNIFYGDTAGTFRPDDVITRAEVVAVVNRLQGLSDAAKAAAGTTMYTDVATTDWFAGDVNLASQMGIVAGDGNGLFRPNDQVKYEEAVKMMVAALGYKQDYVLKQGGWPTGYLVIATDAGVTKGLSVSAGEPAPRGIVAKLAYQSLAAPMMVLSSYDDDGKANYRPDETKTLLGEKLGYAKLIGNVTANEVTDTSIEKGYFEYKLDGRVTYSEIGDQDIWNGGWGYDKQKDETYYIPGKNINANGTDVASTFGYATEIYIDEVNDEPVVLTYIVSDHKNEVAVIENVKDIQAAEKQAATNTQYASLHDGSKMLEISVYNEETDATNEVYKLDSDVVFVVNGGTEKVDGMLDFKPAEGKLELLDNDQNGKYDYVFVTSYRNVVFDGLYAQNKKISAIAGGNVDMSNFVDEKDGYSYTITLDGEEIALTDLEKYDVLSIAETKAGNSRNIIVSRNVVEGAVEAIEKLTTGDIYTVGGAEYKKAVGAEGEIKSTSAGKFYIDAFGKIALFEGETALTGNVAFIQAAGKFPYMGVDDYELEVLNKDGSVVVLNFADYVTVKEGNTDVDLDGDTTNAKSTKASVYDKIEALIFGGDATEDKDLASFADRIITYKTNSTGKISAITFAKSGSASEGLFIATQGGAGVEYEEDVQALDFGVTDATTIFFLPVDAKATKDDYTVANIDFLADGEKYDVKYLDIDNAGNAGILVITSNNLEIAKKASLAVVTKSTLVTNEEGDKEVELTLLHGGKEVTIRVNNDLEDDASKFVRGDVFEFGTDAEGKIDEYSINKAAKKKIGAKANKATAEYYVDPTTGFIHESRPSGNPEFSYVGGYVVAKNGSILTIAQTPTIATKEGSTNKYIDATIGTKIAIPETANVYYMDAGKEIVRPVVDTVGCVVPTKVDVDGNYEKDAQTFVLIKYIDKTIVDVIVYQNY